MSSDLIIYLPVPVNYLLDHWENKFAALGGSGGFDDAAKAQIRTCGSYMGFFPVGESGFELYLNHLTEPETGMAGKPPTMRTMYYKAVLTMRAEEWEVGRQCADALAVVANGIVYDPQTGTYPRGGLIVERTAVGRPPTAPSTGRRDWWVMPLIGAVLVVGGVIMLVTPPPPNIGLTFLLSENARIVTAIGIGLSGAALLVLAARRR